MSDIEKKAEEPGTNIYDWIVLFRDLTLDLIPFISLITGVWLFGFSSLPPERVNTLSVFLGLEIALPKKNKL